MKILLLVFCCVFAFSLQAKDKKTASTRYDIECAGAEGKGGTYLVQVWVYASKANVKIDELKKAAVHGILFRGYGAASGCQPQKPLAQSAALENEKADFFDAFFNNGEYTKYATALESSFVSIKLSKKEYKVGMAVSVSKDQLRKDLQAAGILQKLGGNIF